MKGEELKSHIERRWRTTPLPASTAITSAWESDPSPAARFFGASPKSPRQIQIDHHHTDTVDQVLAELAGGSLLALGRFKCADGALSDPVEISPSFWLDARFHYGYGAASAGDLFFDKLKVLVEAAPHLEPSETATVSMPPAAVVKPKRGGRTNYSAETKRIGIRLWTESEEFRDMGRRQQAREVRAQMVGEKARTSDNMSGCTTESMMRWLGEALPGKRTDKG